jgi:hypothetical protein
MHRETGVARYNAVEKCWVLVALLDADWLWEGFLGNFLQRS